MATSDELAQTADAAGAAPAVGEPPATLGRFQLLRVLGEGGMGIVHEAFDPELERRVALKVLHHASSVDAHARLLREARVMAKLSHPNVITVFEVGSARGQDFVAMELVEGETLGEWIRRTKPSWRPILAAYMAAGRGLISAHAAGLVHRDFKPNNVLRSNQGKILVTDFGLARASLPSVDDVTSSGGEIDQTATGLLVGTPAYMAPEQWTGSALGPATDQFAFCVAVWEALAGARPFRGNTLDELRRAVLAGPSRLDSTRVPRRLRAVLRRGLAVDPARRWPSMDALLAVLQRIAGRRRMWITTASIGALTIAAVVAWWMTGDRNVVANPCPLALDPAQAWSAERAHAIESRDAEAATLVGDDVSRWRTLRAAACKAPAAVRSTRLACLDGVLARLDAVVSSVLAERGSLDADAMSIGLIDPAMCDRDPAPRIAPTSPELVSSLSLHRRVRSASPAPSDDELAAGERAKDPCAGVVANMARAESIDERDSSTRAPTLLRALELVDRLGDACDDDAIKTEARLWSALSSAVGVSKANAIVDAFPQDDRRALVEATNAVLAQQSARWDAMVSSAERAVELYGRRKRARSQLDVVRREIRGLLERGRPEDRDLVTRLYATWLPVARRVDRSGVFAQEAVLMRWRAGEVAAADIELELIGRGSLQVRLTGPTFTKITVSGIVVDDDGRPVPDAEVFGGANFLGDSARMATSWYSLDRTSTRTARDGTFSLQVPDRGLIGAQAGQRRSIPMPVAPFNRIAVHATGRIEGRVVLGTLSASSRWVQASFEVPGHRPVMLVAPLLVDGRFELEGVPLGRVEVGVATFGLFKRTAIREVLVEPGRPAHVELVLRNVALHLIARSADLTPPEGAIVWLFPAFELPPHPILTDILEHHTPLLQTHALPSEMGPTPAELASTLVREDLLATVADRPEGELVACAIGFRTSQIAGASSIEKLAAAFMNQEVACVRVGRDQMVARLDLLPLRKLP